MIARAAFLAVLGTVSAGALAATISGGVVTEDFTTLDYADRSLPSSAITTGVWDVANGRVRAHAFADGAAGSTRPIDFGDGSDGTVASTTGYVFNTDTHPNGFNFISLAITGGTLSVTGSNPLVIRSLTTITITPTLNLRGPSGASGSTGGTTVPGPVTSTCLAAGGFGGSANGTAGQDGGDSITSDGTPEGAGNYGRGRTALAPAIVDGQGSSAGPADSNFELNPAAFLCGAGGPGGGGYSAGGGGAFASGGAGGSGGGRVHLVAVGNVSVTAVTAKGGDGGNGVLVAAGPVCSGNGSGGNGGSIWMQTLGGITTGTPPDVTGGTSGVSTCSIGSDQSLITGFTRGDTAAAGARPAWASGSFDTDVVPPLLTSTVQSKAYPLGVLNAGFSAPVVTSSGSIAVEYAGSQDGVTFDAYDSDLTALSNRNYRFVRWRATLTNPGGPGASPEITRITMPFEELGLGSVDLKLAAGCGTIAASGGGGSAPRPWNRNDGANALLTAIALICFFGISHIFRTGPGRSRS
jgi:hypothetical protein